MILEREEGSEKENNIDVRATLMGERNIDQLPPVYALTRDCTHNLGMFPDWGSNLQPFGVQEDAPAD